MSSIVNHVIDTTITAIESQMSSGTFVVGLVKSGKLQDDPTVNITNVLIFAGEENWPHTLNTKPEGFVAPAYEVFGNQFNVRRFRAQMQFFFDGFNDHDEARVYAYEVLSKLEVVITGVDVFQLTDSYNELAMFLQVRDSYLQESGGEGTFIFRGNVKFEVLTERTRAAA